MQARTNRNPKKELTIESPQKGKDAGPCEVEAESPVVVLVRTLYTSCLFPLILIVPVLSVNEKLLNLTPMRSSSILTCE